MDKQPLATFTLIVAVSILIIIGAVYLFKDSPSDIQTLPSSDVQTSTSSLPSASTQSTLPYGLDPETALLFEGQNKEEGTRLHVSEKLGVGFTYDPTPNDSTEVTVTEKDNIMYVHYTNQKPEDGQRVEVFTIEPASSIEEAITKKFLQGINKKKCFVEVNSGSEQRAGYVTAGISYVSNPSDEPGIIPELCPQVYSKTNGKRYFLMNTNVPTKLLFVNIGQDVLTTDGTPQDPTKDFYGYDWAHSLRVVK